jgi:hypothetical protein
LRELLLLAVVLSKISVETELWRAAKLFRTRLVLVEGWRLRE